MDVMRFDPSSWSHSRGGDYEITIHGSFFANPKSYSQSAREADILLSSSGKGIIGSSAIVHIRDDLTPFAGQGDDKIGTEYELVSQGNYLIRVHIPTKTFADMLCRLMNALPIKEVQFPEPMEFSNGGLLRNVRTRMRNMSSLQDPTIIFGRPKQD